MAALIDIQQIVWDEYDKSPSSDFDPYYLSLGLECVGSISRITGYTTDEMKAWLRNIKAEEMTEALEFITRSLFEDTIPRRTNPNLDMDGEEHDLLSFALKSREMVESQIFSIELWRSLVTKAKSSKSQFQKALVSLIAIRDSKDHAFRHCGWTQDPTDFLGHYADLYDDRKERPAYFWSASR